MPELKHLSYSSINMFLLCPRSWEFRYVKKLQTPISVALPFGSAFHATVEQFVADHQKPNYPGLAQSWVQNWAAQQEKEGDRIAWDKETPESMAAMGARMLDKLNVSGGGPNRKMTAAAFLASAAIPLIENEQPVIEKRIKLHVPGIPIPVIGYIDMMAVDGVPIDFKTASRAWYAQKVHDDLQPAFYLAALNQLGCPSPGGKFRYIIFTKAKAPRAQIIETKRTVEQLLWLVFNLIPSVWQSIEAGAFAPNPSTWKCSPKWCEYWDRCRGG